MSSERDEAMMDYRLTPDEVNELKAQLDAGEWEALLAVQRELLQAPAAAPAAGFAGRVTARIQAQQSSPIGLYVTTAQQVAHARRRSLFGGLAFAFGSFFVVGLFALSSPLGTVVEIWNWATLLDAVATAITVTWTLSILLLTFVQVLARLLGGQTLVLLAAFAFALTLLWTRVIGAGPLSRQETFDYEA